MSASQVAGSWLDESTSAHLTIVTPHCCRDVAMVQLSVLLCCIPLALENAMMQAHITQASADGCNSGACMCC